MDRHELRQRRRKLGLTQRQVADWLDRVYQPFVSQSFVAQMESGVRAIPSEAPEPELDSIAVQLDDLFAGLEADFDDPGIRAVIGYPRRGPYRTAPDSG